MAACSTTRRNSSERSESIALSQSVEVDGVRRRFDFCTSCVRRQLAARRTVGPIAEQVVGLHEFVDLARAFVDDRALAVADRSARPDTRRSSRWRRESARRRRRPSPRRRSRTTSRGRSRACCACRGSSSSRSAARAAAPPGSRTPCCAIISFTSWCWPISTPNVLPLLRVFHAGVAAGADQPGRAGGHRVASLIEREHRDLEALAELAERRSPRAPRRRPS